MCPESLVADVEEGAPIQRIVLDGRQVPHLGLYLSLTRTIRLHAGRWNNECATKNLQGIVILNDKYSYKTCIIFSISSVLRT